MEKSAGNENNINSAFCKRYWDLKHVWDGTWPMLADAFWHLLANIHGPLCGLSSADLWQKAHAETKIHNWTWQLSVAEWIKPVQWRRRWASWNYFHMQEEFQFPKGILSLEAEPSKLSKIINAPLQKSLRVTAEVPSEAWKPIRCWRHISLAVQQLRW